MRIYTFMMAIIVSSLINVTVNVRIFIHHRSFTRRVQPRSITALTLTINIQNPEIRRRKVSLLRQMIFMFSMFVGGWSSIWSTMFIMHYYELICNHELRQFVLNKIREVFRQQE